MILIVDDKKENILPLQKILELHKLESDSANSGEEALRKILKRNYSLIIMDVQMPGMDGFEVVEALSGSNRTKDIPVIFLSAINKEKKYFLKGFESGGVDYITKPVDPDLLILKVKAFLKLYEQQNELKNTRDLLSKEIEIRKEAQENLSAQMQELRSVLRSLPQIAFTMSKSGVIEYANEPWFEYSEDSKTFPEMHPDDKRECENWQHSFADGTEFSREVRIKKLQTNEFRFFLMKVVPVKVNETVMRWVGTLTDIHEQKRANEILEEKVTERTQELVAKNEALEFSNHELQQFAWAVSHDLQEPLRKIQMFVRLIKDRYLDTDEKANDYIDRAIKSAERMTRLIDELLEYSRLSSDREAVDVNLDDILGEVLADLDYASENKNATINAQKLPHITGVPGQMRQVLQNLIGNALKFVGTQAPVIDIQCERIAEKNFDSKSSVSGDYWRITVQDNGIGFDQKYTDKIFTIFQRLNDRHAFEGTGIGLAIAKKIIEKHNGLITARSQGEGKGARFIIILPNQTNKKNQSSKQT